MAAPLNQNRARQHHTKWRHVRTEGSLCYVSNAMLVTRDMAVMSHLLLPVCRLLLLVLRCGSASCVRLLLLLCWWCPLLARLHEAKLLWLLLGLGLKLGWLGRDRSSWGLWYRQHWRLALYVCCLLSLLTITCLLSLLTITYNTKYWLDSIVLKLEIFF